MFTLGRKIDIKYPTNQIILGASAYFIYYRIFHHRYVFPGYPDGSQSFLTWALVREIDCKRIRRHFGRIFSFD